MVTSSSFDPSLWNPGQQLAATRGIRIWCEARALSLVAEGLNPKALRLKRLSELSERFLMGNFQAILDPGRFGSFWNCKCRQTISLVGTLSSTHHISSHVQLGGQLAQFFAQWGGSN